MAQTQDIVAKILANVQADEQQVMAFGDEGIQLAKNLIKANVAPILEIESEAQACDVVEQIVVSLINKSMPFFLKPIEGIIVTRVINWLDKNVLDKYVGATWFEKLQAMATSLQAQSEK